jgi:DNA-binding GntR family transcriptional regulator
MRSLRKTHKHGKEQKSLVEIAFGKIENMILTLELEPGSIWSEIELSQLIGIGRTPVREAVKLLENAYLVIVIPRRGILINEFRIDEFILQMEVRRPLEILISKRAAKHATAEERQIFNELTEEYIKATVDKDKNYAIEVSDRFNELAGHCSRNPYAHNAIAPLHAVARKIYYMKYDLDEKLIEEINYSHVDVIKAIADGDVEKAIDKNKKFLDSLELLVRP